MARKKNKLMVSRGERNRAHKITHEEVAAAVARFRERGGTVRELPKQVSGPRHLVGALYGAFETVRVDPDDPSFALEL